MNLFIIIPIFNRPAYLQECLESLKRSEIPANTKFILIDDCSTDERTKSLIWEFALRDNVILIRNKKNSGVAYSLRKGFEMALNMGADILMNLDSDGIVRNDWIEQILELQDSFDDEIITGFNCLTKNRDGSERHKVIRYGNDWIEKKSVGGLNMCFDLSLYKKFVLPALEVAINKGYNWDHQACINAGGAICCVPSVVQHIGMESSMNHNEQPDIALDFKPIALKNVTLICVDDNLARCSGAIQESRKNIEFGDIRIITSGIGESLTKSGVNIFAIKHLGSKEAYSNFIINELHKYIDTDFALVIQHDGYILDALKWNPDWLNYDYIGAPWEWYKDEFQVGNGGFSLRSKKLLQLTPKIVKTIHPEDHNICRTYRKELESHGIKFAPKEVAEKFSFEGYASNKRLNGQFGFHGRLAISQMQPQKNKQGFIINQFLGLGDILFLIPLVRKWIYEGHDVIWPIADEYFSIKENFPDIQFVKKSAFPMAYDTRKDFMHKFKWGIYKVKSLRWNHCPTLLDAMTSKYTMFGEDWHLWRDLYWQRNEKKEDEVYKLTAGALQKYELHSINFGNATDGGLTFKQVGTSGLYAVNIVYLPGYNLLDWAKVIENAEIIHAVSSSCVYLFEMLNLKAKEIHLYSRKLGNQDFDYVRRLMTKNYILHV